MSYQYHPYIEHYSPSPATVTPQAFAQWEVPEDPLVSPVQQQQNSTSPEQEQTTTPNYEAPQVIQLVERPLRRPRPQNQAQKQLQVSPSTPARGTKQQQQLTPQSLSPASGAWYDVRDVTARASANGSKDLTVPAKQAIANRAQVRFASHPYHRRAVSGDAKSRRERESVVQSGAGGIIPYTLMACGGPTTDDASSPSPSASPNADAAPVEMRRLLIRTDIHFSSETSTMTVMLELPGVKKADLRLSLGICQYSRVKQLTVRGKSAPIFADEGYTIRERKHGEFKRILVVPPDTKPEDIQVKMEDGILFLKFPAASPTAKEESTSIPVN